ncbi:MAG: hypothetical protein RIR09_1808 [Pseudomonadota bacterium]|jgi:uncharacterized protein YceK
MRRTTTRTNLARRYAIHLAWMVCMLSGCAAVAVVDTAATIAVKTVGLAADATIGTVRIAGRAVGAVADAALPAPAAAP